MARILEDEPAKGQLGSLCSQVYDKSVLGGGDGVEGQIVAWGTGGRSKWLLVVGRNGENLWQTVASSGNHDMFVVGESSNDAVEVMQKCDGREDVLG